MKVTRVCGSLPAKALPEYMKMHSSWAPAASTAQCFMRISSGLLHRYISTAPTLAHPYWGRAIVTGGKKKKTNQPHTTNQKNPHKPKPQNPHQTSSYTTLLKAALWIGLSCPPILWLLPTCQTATMRGERSSSREPRNQTETAITNWSQGFSLEISTIHHLFDG